MIIPVLLFILGLILLIKGGDWFVDGATGIAHRFKIPDIIIGATVVSIGTTLPEVMVSATSALQGLGSMAYGNAIGSIICNTSLIAALTIAIRPTEVPRKSMIVPVCFFFFAAAVYAGVAYISGNFSRFTGLFLLLIFVVYMTVLIIRAKKEMALSKSESGQKESTEDKKIQNVTVDEENEISAKVEKATKNFLQRDSVVKEIFLLIIGAALITVGANLLVDNGTIIAESLGVPQSVIALTIVALGTSLPELVTAVTSLVKGHSSLSLGNIIGANLFNLVLVSGVSITLNPFSLPAEKTIMIGGIARNASLVIDVPLFLIVMILMTIPTLIKGKLKRWQGIALLAIYAAYLIFQFVG